MTLRYGRWRAIRRGWTAECLGLFAAFQFANFFFHFLARLKGYDELLRYVDLVAGARITRLASGTLLDLEHPKIPQLNPAFLDERFDDGVEGLLNDFLRLQLGETDLVGNRFHNLFLGHDCHLL